MTGNHIIYEIVTELFGEVIDIPGLTEIAVNRPGEMFLKISGKWSGSETKFSLGQYMAFAVALADFNQDSLTESKPVLSATLPGGERVQVIIPPATEQDTISVTIRKPSGVFIEHSQFISQGFYSRINTLEEAGVSDDTRQLIQLYNDNNIAEFIPECIQQGKTMVFCGGTGSGKTTFSNAVIRYIPENLRLITIEDTPETNLNSHQNHVKLFYTAEGSKDIIVTPAMLLRSTFRMNPDRILMTEIRGGEAWDFLKGISSGHAGGITTVHENTPESAITGMVERCYQNTECSNLPYNVLLRKVLKNTDVIMSIKYSGDSNKRYATGIYFKDLHYDSCYESLRG